MGTWGSQELLVVAENCFLELEEFVLYKGVSEVLKTKVKILTSVKLLLFFNLLVLVEPLQIIVICATINFLSFLLYWTY